MKLTKILAILLAALLCLSLASCGESEENKMPIEETSPSQKSFTATDEYVKSLGRNILQDGSLWLIHSAACIEFTVNGTKLSITLVGDDTVFSDEGKVRYAVYLDGERLLDGMMDSPEKTVEVFNHTEPALHTVKVIKLSESAQSIFGIKSIDAECIGVIKPTEYKDLKIEFIGDSITCAYGVDDEVKEHGFSTTTEDATKSYAYLACEELDADYSLVCYSGHGIISAYTGDGTKNTSGLVPDIYTQVGKAWGQKNPDITQKWDFDSFEPDYIVINLGTNDNSYVQGNKDKAKEFVEEYAEFIKYVRKYNKNAHIVCALGVMGDELFSAIEEAVTLSGDDNISTLHLSGRASTDPIAADWHPAYVTQQRAAGEVAAHIKGLE